MNTKLIDEISKIKEIEAPQWGKFVKTGAHKERTPNQENWWDIRTASILLKIRKFGPIGTNKLSKHYGGRKNRGHKPEKKYAGSRNIIRKSLQQLEKAGLIAQNKGEKKGKILSKKGAELIKKVEA
jgi:small subunit ribosomal protein S19e